MNSWLYRLHDTYCICASAYCVYSDNVSMSDDDEQDYHYRRFEDEDKDSATNETQSAAGKVLEYINNNIQTSGPCIYHD